MISSRALDEYSVEVVAALRELGDRRLGTRVAADRRSAMEHLGIRFPVLRARVKEGFSFYDLPEAEILAVWDHLWRTSPYGDVLFAALEYYVPRARKRVAPALWPVVRRWPQRVDNWCHADGLSSLYSWILADEREEVYPQLDAWNRSSQQWLRRISLVSLIHYSGKNAVFMPVDRVLPLVTRCVPDEREYIQNAVGWVLRELTRAHPVEVAAYLREHVGTLSAGAFRRAVERYEPGMKAELQALRREAEGR